MAVRICAESEIERGESVRVLVGDTAIALIRDGSGTFHAIDDLCSHAEIPLSEGFVDGGRIECWAHGAQFDLATGRALSLPATDAVPVYEVSVVDGDIYVEITA